MLLDRIPYHRTRVEGPQDTTLAKSRIFGRTVKKLKSYYTIPAFSVDNNWRGASEIIYRFDFPAGLITLLNIFPITPPTGSNFCPVVAWKVGETFVRYKLWEDVGEILWLPLYNKEKITASEFYIEIWNVNPSAEATGLETLESEEDEGIEFEEDDTIVETEESSGDLELPVAITTQLLESIVIYTSRLVIPSPICNETESSLGAPTTCVDPIYHLEDFQPLYGDYYTLIAPCERELIKGVIAKPVYNLLKNRNDDTWHYVWAQFVAGELFLYVDPTNELNPPVDALGYFPLVSAQDRNTYKMELMWGPGDTGNFTVIDTTIAASASDINVALLQDTDTFSDAILWALYLRDNGAGGQTYEFITSNSFNASDL